MLVMVLEFLDTCAKAARIKNMFKMFECMVGLVYKKWRYVTFKLQAHMANDHFLIHIQIQAYTPPQY